MIEVDYAIAIEKDIPLLVEYRMQFLEEVSGLQPGTVLQTVRKSNELYFAKAIKEQTYICWIAHFNDEAVSIGGMAVHERPANYGSPNGKIAYIMNMFTLPEYRGKGLCSEILKRLEDSAREMGIKILELHATPAGEPVYRNHGFGEPRSRFLEKRL